MARNIEIWTDGSCWASDRLGGWAFVISEKDEIIMKEYGGMTNTTSQRMEMIAAIEALQWVIANRPEENNVILNSDSAYLINGMNAKWYEVWIINSWIGVKNRDLWEKMIELSSQIKVKFNKVRGHSGVRNNELADELAGMGRQEAIKFVKDGTNIVPEKVQADGIL